jgi:CIC family chloride channel protein
MSTGSFTSKRAFWTARARSWAEADRLSRHEDKLILMLTLVIGAVVGLVVVAFILLTERLGAHLYPAEGAAWRRLLFPTAGAVVTGWLLTRYFPNARGSGIPQTKVALFLRNGRILFRTVLGKFGCSSVSLASGIALGREGPAVQVGAGIASVLGRWLGLPSNRVKDLVPIGSAAALAAAFNTPIAAILFTLEEVLGNLHAPVLGGIVLSSATSWVVLHLLMGDEPLFHVPTYQMVHPFEFGIYAILGVAGGLVSVAFVKILLGMRNRFLRMPGRTVWLQPAVGGLLVGLFGWWVPQVLGVGYVHVGAALNGRMALSLMALLLVLKLFATATCYASGNAGGIFGPSLFIGAMLGGTVGTVAHGMLPDYTGGAGAYALVGMGTAFAGIIRAPLTSVIMIFEITRDYSIIVPVMIANLVAYFISRRFQPEPIYEALLHQEGIHLPPGRIEAGTTPVLGAMQPVVHVLSADDRIPASVTALRGTLASTTPAADAHAPRAWPVLDGNSFVGMLTEVDIARGARDRAGATLRDILPARNLQGHITAETFPHVHADQPVEAAMRRMARTGLDVLPVVDRGNPRALLGTISMNDILKAFAREADDSAVVASRAETARPAALLATIVVVLVGSFILMGFLTRYYHVQRQTTAKHFMENGNELLRQNRTVEAIQQYRNAVSLTHSNEDRLTLALALMQADMLDDARVYLGEFHRAAPRDGRADLALARIAARQGRISDAVLFYRDATSAVWPDKTQEQQIDAEFELVDFLQKTGASKQALADLLSLADRVKDGPVRIRIAGRMLALGAPSEAADLFRQVIHDAPAAAYAGLGQADFAQAQYPAARDALRTAHRLNPDDSEVDQRLALVDKILALDPTLRGLGSVERHSRSLKLLEGSLGALEQCIAVEGSPTGAVKDAIDKAHAVLSARRRPRSFGDAAEANIALAEQLWAGHEQSCRDAPVDEALRRVLAHLSQ